MVAEDDASDGAEDWDADAALKFQYSLDGAAFQTVLAFEATSGTNTEPKQDTDFNGLGDGTALSPTFQTFIANIPDTGSSLVIRARYENLEAGDEDVAIDNLIISGDTATPSLVSFVRQNSAEAATNSDSLVFRATFSEAVQNVDPADFTVTGTSATAAVAQVDALTYDITVSGGDLPGFNGAVGLNLAAGQNIQDLDGNTLPDIEPATDETFQVDNNAPEVSSLSPADGASDVFDILDLMITFDENVRVAALGNHALALSDLTNCINRGKNGPEIQRTLAACVQALR